MKEFKNDKEKLEFMKPIIARYRIFIMHFLNITRTELIEQLSLRMNKPVETLHLKNITDLQDSYDIIEELKVWKKELCGTRILPLKVNPRQYADKIKLKLNDNK